MTRRKPFEAVNRRTVLRGGMMVGSAAALGGLVAACGPAGREDHPTTIIHNGKVFIGTTDGAVAEAVAITASGTVGQTGSNTDILATAGPTTKRIDAAGATVMAGIVDGHAHPLAAAGNASKPSLGKADMTVPKLQTSLQQFLDASRDREPDGWLSVGDWSPVGLLPSGTVAHRSMLDALSTKRPIILQGSDFHNSLVNSRALALAGVTRDTPDPAGGQIARDAHGEPTGLLKDSAQDLVRAVITPPSEDESRAAAAMAIAMMLSVGITAFMDAAADAGAADLYSTLARTGAMHQRALCALHIEPELAAKPHDAVDYVTQIASAHAGIANVRFGIAKVFLDGVMEFPAQTAALLQPYLAADGTPTAKTGDLYVDHRTMIDLVTSLDAAGWQVHSHAIGDRAVRTALDAYTAAVKTNGNNDRRHTITHLQLVHPDDIGRFAAVGAVASMQLQWAVRDSFTQDSLAPYIGTDRFDRLYPSKTLQAAGAVLAGGSDWPIDPLNPFLQIEYAITRGADAATAPLGPDQALDRADVLRMHTAGSAHQLHLDDVGTLEPGRRADIVVLDRDLLSVPADDIHNTTVRYTLIEGDIVYDATKPPPMSVAPAAFHPASKEGGPAVAANRHDACCGRKI